MDEEFLPHIASLDSMTFRQLMTKYGPDVWNYAYMLTRSRELADDISQDVFIKVYKKISTFRGDCTFRTWLFAITRRTALNYRRIAFFRMEVVGLVKNIGGISRSAENEALDRLESEDFWNEVLRLPVKLREVLLLEGRHDMAVKEIAALLNLSEGTVKSRLHRARQKLSVALKEESPYERA